MVGTLQRYVDIDKTRSLMDPSRAGHYPLPYETIQMSHDEQDPAKANQEMRAFLPKVSNKLISRNIQGDYALSGRV